jgi:hypothetical protein
MSEPRKVQSACVAFVHRLGCGVATGREAGAEFGPSIPTFRFDDQKVQQVARNLLNFALRQALPSGTVTLRWLSRPNGAGNPSVAASVLGREHAVRQ